MRTILPWSRSGCHTDPPEGVRSPSFSSTHHNCNSVTGCYLFVRLAVLGGEGGCVAHVTAATRINCCCHSVPGLLAHLCIESLLLNISRVSVTKSRPRGRKASLISALSWFPHFLQEVGSVGWGKRPCAPAWKGCYNVIIMDTHVLCRCYGSNCKSKLCCTSMTNARGTHSFTAIWYELDGPGVG